MTLKTFLKGWEIVNMYKLFHEKSFSCIVSVFIIYSVLYMGLLTPVWALEPAPPGEIERLKAEGQFESSLEMAKKVGNHKVAPHLITKLKEKIRLLQEKRGQRHFGILASPPPGRQGGLPSVGSPKIFALLIEFQDYTHTFSAADINDMLFDDGNPANFPRESLTEYYKRASYNLLDLGNGTTLGWYQTAYNRSAVTDREALIKEVLNHYDGLGHDFSQYDNDNDGDIEYFIVMWAGPSGAWATFWWGWNLNWGDGTYTIDGKTLSNYSWQQESDSPSVVMHETGHSFGLPDLYDYDNTVGPGGGVGGFDMMDGNIADVNCFWKWMLDWLTPTVVSGGLQNLTLDDTATSTECVLIWPGIALADIFSELYIVQNRQNVENDSGLWFTPDGLAIWHIDATLDGSGNNFAYNNSDTSHKLVRLMEADGLEEIETTACCSGCTCAYADSGDLFTAGDAIGQNTTPSSDKYDGTDSCVRVWDISDLGVAAGSEISASFSTICNQPPVCDANGNYTAECQGNTTTVSLDGSGSSDPDPGDTLTYLWTTDCPGGSFNNSASSTPVLTVNTAPGCVVSCTVNLTVTDGVGESSNCSASVTIHDTQNPVISYCPVNVTIECDESTDPSHTGSATATDACDVSPLVTHADTITLGTCPDEWQIARIWTANDDCGHSSNCQQTINVEDNTAPAITCPSDITIECDESTDPSNTGSATAIDNCDGSPTVTFADVVASDPSCPVEKNITRTWSAADACGNVNSCSQVITVEDTTAPVIACNAPATITPPDAPISFTASATDNCDTDPAVAITAYDCFTYTKKGKRINKTESCIVQVNNNVVTILDSGGVADTITWAVRSSDCAGNVSTSSCSVHVVNPAK